MCRQSWTKVTWREFSIRTRARVARWLHRQASPRPESRERVLELLAVLERLSGVVQAQAAHDWLFTPNATLDHHKPVDLLRGGSIGGSSAL